MTTIPDSRDLTAFKPIVNFDEPPRKPAPLLAVGPLAWVRNNLFRSWFDAIITLVGGVLIIGAVTSLVSWVVSDANWYAVTFNFRLFMIGRFEAEYEWRVAVWVLLVAFTIGLSFAAWGRIRRRIMIALGVVVALMFILPPLIAALLPEASTYFAAGDVPIAAGSDNLNPQRQIAFIARAGETIHLELAGAAADDETLATLSGFADDAANQLSNTADTRLTNTARIAEIEALLAGDTLTQNQRDRLTIERGKLTIADLVSVTYALNQSAVTVQVLRGTTEEVIAEGTLEADSVPLQITLPEDGWYILDKQVAGGQTDALLRAQGVFPILERNLNRSASEGDSGGRFSQFVRITDLFTTEEIRPAAEGKNLPITQLTDTQFRGRHSLTDYLTLFLGPFLKQINQGALLLVAALLIGYGVGRYFIRSTPAEHNPQVRLGRVATWLLIALPLLMFVFIYGLGNPLLPSTDTQRWGGLILALLLTVTGIIASFPIGILLALGRRSSLPAISALSTLYIEFVRGVPLITVLFMSQLLVPLINPALAELPGVFRAMVGIILFSAAYLAENVRGGLQSVPPGQEEAAKALGLSGLQITVFITLPQALRAVIPALVGQFISLFKDTSLVAIVGLLDLIGMYKNVLAQTEFLGTSREVLLFVGLIYLGFSYTMATISRRIEASGAGKVQARKI